MRREREEEGERRGGQKRSKNQRGSKRGDEGKRLRACPRRVQFCLFQCTQLSWSQDSVSTAGVGTWVLRVSLPWQDQTRTVYCRLSTGPFTERQGLDEACVSTPRIEEPDLEVSTALGSVYET